MSSCSSKRYSLIVIYFLVILVVALFLIITILTYNILQHVHCNCTQQTGDTKRKKETKSSSSSHHRLAVLVPFRDRFDELLVFVPYIDLFLNKQKIDHSIFVLNQVDSYRFNRASLINVGYIFTEANFDYVVMHDVDLLPLNDDLSYSYPKKQPFHVAAPNLHPRYHYEKFVGGILLINREQFKLVNGMSNKYWGWGLEDDEFFVRLRDAKLTVSRPVGIKTGKNNTFRHIHDRTHRKRDTAKCYNQREVTRKRDRQTGLHDVNYTIRSITELQVDGVAVTVININLNCDRNATPWCDCSGHQQRSLDHIKTNHYTLEESTSPLVFTPPDKRQPAILKQHNQQIRYMNSSCSRRWSFSDLVHRRFVNNNVVVFLGLKENSHTRYAIRLLLIRKGNTCPSTCHTSFDIPESQCFEENTFQCRMNEFRFK